MDRIEFLNSIKYNTDLNQEVINILIGFFDQYMVLYNLIENVINISMIGTTNNSINFLLTYSDTDSASKALNKINSINIFNAYNKVFYIQAQSHDKKSNIITIS